MRRLPIARGAAPWLLAAAALACATDAHAQQAAGPTVQLPTFSFFTVNTTVSVPDRGGAYLGGIKRRSGGSSQFGGPLGLPGNRTSSVNGGASGMSVHVTIHDMQEYDRQILAEARAKYGPPAAPGSDAAPVFAGSTAEHGAAGLAELEAAKALGDDATRTAALDLLAKGRAAEAAGKPGAAKAYFRMAARKAPTDLAAEATAALRRLDSPRLAATPSE